MNSTLDNKTCFNFCKENDISCKNTDCRYWHDIDLNHNCIINKANEKKHTLQEIGSLLNITRMRVCQIEKDILSKLKKSLKTI